MSAFDFDPTSSLIFLIVTLAALAAFAEVCDQRIRAMLWGKSENRFDQPWRRTLITLKYAFGQYRMPQELTAGLFHIFIFAGFIVVSLRTLTLFGVGLTGSAGFHLPGFGEAALTGQIYTLVKDGIAALVIVGCLGFAYRRLVSRPTRLRNIAQAEALLILFFITVLMATDLLADAAQRVAAGHTGWWPAPFASLATVFIPAESARANFFQTNVWLHCLLILVFLNYLPFGKHFHIITSVPNVFFSRLTPHGRLEPLRDIEATLERAMEGQGSLGIQNVEHLSWKMILDTYSCTECGRCVPMCPAWATQKPPVVAGGQCRHPPPSDGILCRREHGRRCFR